MTSYTQPNIIRCISIRVILVNLHHRPLKLDRLKEKGNTPTTIKTLFP